MIKYFTKLKLQTKLVLLICLVVAPPIVLENIHIFYLVDKEHHGRAALQAGTVAELVATSPLVIAALRGRPADGPGTLAEYMHDMTRASQVTFTVVIKMDGIRVYHPDEEKIGKMVVGGDEARVLAGESYLSSAKGTLGVSLRAFRPVYDDDGAQIGAVIVGIMSASIKETITSFNQPIWLALFLSLCFGAALAALLAASIKKILLNLEPVEIATLLEERNALLRTVREGIIAINLNGDLTIVNDEAERILRKSGIQGPLLNKKVHEVIATTRLYEIMQSGASEFDCEQQIDGAVILTNRTALTANGVIIGAVATFRDMTEVRQLAEKLTGVHKYADALRSQSHEFMNKLHVLCGLVHNRRYAALSEYLETLIGLKQEENKRIQGSIKDPLLAGFLSSKCSRARELGVQLDFYTSGELPSLDAAIAQPLITILGNLIDNGLEAMEAVATKRLRVNFGITKKELVISISDTGTGMPTTPETLNSIFRKGYSTKGEGRGIGLYLVLMAVDALNGRLDVTNKPGQGALFSVRLPMTGIRAVSL